MLWHQQKLIYSPFITVLTENKYCNIEYNDFKYFYQRFLHVRIIKMIFDALVLIIAVVDKHLYVQEHTDIKHRI